MAEYAVVNKTQLDADMTSVADTIRTKGGTTEQLAWPDGYNAAIEAIQTGGGGGDDFWDVYQRNGTRTRYTDAFNGYLGQGANWTVDTFKPKYSMHPTRANNMFYEFNYGNEPFDLSAHLEALGVELDTSSCTSSFLDNIFYGAAVSRVPPVSFLGGARLSATFESSKIVTIDKIILKADGSTNISSTAFSDMPNLENVTIEGAIASTTGFSGGVAGGNKLTKASIYNIINALATETSGLTMTLRGAAVNKAFETSNGANDGVNSSEWKALIATKPNWTFSLN